MNFTVSGAVPDVVFTVNEATGGMTGAADDENFWIRLLSNSVTYTSSLLSIAMP